jgi:outer membrane biosynthesis protein TonB
LLIQKKVLAAKQGPFFTLKTGAFFICQGEKTTAGARHIALSRGTIRAVLMASTSRIFTYSAATHGLVLLLMVVMCTDGCLNRPPKEEIIPMEFIVVTEENAADVLAEEPNEEVEPEPDPLPTPPTPDPLPPEPKPDPLPTPPELPPEPTPIPPPKKVDPPKPKPPEPKKEKPKPPEPKKEKPKPKPIKIGKRVGPVTTGKKDPKKAATEKAMSAEEIAKLLGAGAKSGSRNQIPPNEASRNYGVIQRVFREACDTYGLETSPTGRDPQIKIEFGPNGAIKKLNIAQ